MQNIDVYSTTASDTVLNPVVLFSPYFKVANVLYVISTKVRFKVSQTSALGV